MQFSCIDCDVAMVSDAGSVLNVAQTQELTQEMAEAAEETVQQLVAAVQPQVATAAPLPPNPDDDSDDGYEMIPQNLPLPDDDSVSAGDAPPYPPSHKEEEEEEAGGGGGAGSSVDPLSDREGSSEPMTTDLDEGGEDGRSSTPTPSETPPTPSETPPPLMMGSLGEEEGEEDRDSVVTLSTDLAADVRGGGGEGSVKSGGEEGGEEPGATDNNNSSSQDPQLTNPIEI